MKLIKLLIFIPILFAFNPREKLQNNMEAPSLIILGTLQDGGSPHIGCSRSCCKDLFLHPDPKRKVVSLGLVDPINRMNYIFEATPDLPSQMKALKTAADYKIKETPEGIFLTHAHIGHYAGLMYLGREAMSANIIPVYVLPKMKSFLESNGPWSQLVNLKNIRLEPIENKKEISLTSQINITPFLVPHRDEYSETAGYLIEGPNKKVLFIPDINKWEVWDQNIIEEIKKVDYAFIDATFYDGNELNIRKMSEIPHPFVIESMEKFKNLPANEKAKVYFIHFNHTNPIINLKSEQAKTVIKNGFHIAQIGQVFGL